MPFTAEELEEMRRADAEIEASFRLTQDDLERARAMDRLVRLETLSPEKRKQAEYRRAYYEANREKVAEYNRAYREANREKLAERQKWILDELRARGYTQAGFAKMLGVSQSAISCLVHGLLALDGFRKADELCRLLGKGNPRLALQRRTGKRGRTNHAAVPLP